jgi:hypothetical protein
MTSGATSKGSRTSPLWVQPVAGEAILVNSLTAISWNSPKRYLHDLTQKVMVVSTKVVAQGELWSPSAQDYVIKPAVASGAIGAARERDSELAVADRHLRRLHQLGQSACCSPRGRRSTGTARLISSSSPERSPTPSAKRPCCCRTPRGTTDPRRSSTWRPDTFFTSSATSAVRTTSLSSALRASGSDVRTRGSIFRIREPCPQCRASGVRARGSPGYLARRRPEAPVRAVR